MEQQNAYHLVINEDKAIEWQNEGENLTVQPARSLFQSIGYFFWQVFTN